MTSFSPLVFTGFAALVLFAAGVIAFSKNLVHSAFSLLAAFVGVAAFFVLLGADFIAVIQLVVYVGGIMVLYLFAVLMTSGIGDVKLTNASIAVKAALPSALLLFLLLAKLIYSTPWYGQGEVRVLQPTTAGIGNALLTEYLLPFELGSVLLLATLVGAVALGRREVEEKPQENNKSS